MNLSEWQYSCLAEADFLLVEMENHLEKQPPFQSFSLEFLMAIQ
jgi:hypothetical protein